MDSGKNIKGLGEVSFSSYLRTSEENFIQKLTDSARFPNHSITSSPEFPSSRSLGRKKTEGGEIGVFDAEKYYNMKLDGGPIIIDTASNHGCNKVPQVDLLLSKTKSSRPGTPSVRSEASWNSQTALLRTYQRTLSQKEQKKVHRKGFFAGLSCNGSCSDKKSVYINQDVEHGGLVRGKDDKKESIQAAHSSIMLNGRKKRQPRIMVKDDFCKPSFEKMSVESNKDEFLAIPIAKSGFPNLAVKKQSVKEKIEEESRKSLEVFGSQTLNKEVIEMNLGRKLSMLTWDAIPKTSKLPTSSVRSQVYEDIESDASSDLFEIENISGSGQPVMFRRQKSDGMPSCMSPTPYAPSETSIEWSVVTASAADFSVVSDYDVKKLTENMITPPLDKVSKTKSTDKDVKGSLPSKLLGCKSQRAVRVAETAYRINDKATSHSQQPLWSVAPIPARLRADVNGEGYDYHN